MMELILALSKESGGDGKKAARILLNRTKVRYQREAADIDVKWKAKMKGPKKA